MLLFTSTTEKLQVVTGSAGSIDVHASWADHTTTAFTPGSTNTAITTAATTDVVAAPAASTQRQLKALTIRNKHATDSNAITIQHVGTVTVELFKYTLAVGEVITFVDGVGFRVFDSTGNVKSVGATGPAGATGGQGPTGPAVFLTGEDGADGEPGKPGTDGATGSTGNTGAQGPLGPATFLTAEDGADGEPGPPGRTGVDGAAGPTGAQGPTGPAAFLLDAGDDGEPGSPGMKGDKGDTGAAGGITLISGSSGAAASGAAPTETWQRLTANAPANTSTTLTTVMSTTALPIGTWLLEYFIIWRSATATVGVNFSVGFSGTVTGFRATRHLQTTGTTAANGVSDGVAATLTGQLVEHMSTRSIDGSLGPNTGVDTINADQFDQIRGILVVSTAGTLLLNHASETATSTQVMAATSLVLRRLG